MRLMVKKLKNQDYVGLALRIGLAIVFLYAGVESLRQPATWEAYLPTFMTKAVSASVLIKFFAVYELVLAAWLLTGKYVKHVAALSALTLAGIVATNPSQLLTTFRDIGLAFMAVALFFNER